MKNLFSVLLTTIFLLIANSVFAHPFMQQQQGCTNSNNSKNITSGGEGNSLAANNTNNGCTQITLSQLHNQVIKFWK